MDLNINSPSYYTQEYGVDDDIYWMCRELSNFVKEKKYSVKCQEKYDKCHILNQLQNSPDVILPPCSTYSPRHPMAS